MRQIGSGWQEVCAARPRAASGPGRERFDPLRDGERPARHLRVQQLDHLAVELDRAAAGILRQREGGDDRPRRLDLGRGRREGRVADFDLVGMDQRLAVEAEVAPLLAFGLEAGGIVEIVEDAVDDVAAMGARASP